MNRSIKSYEDLLQEEKRLAAELESYKLLIKDDIASLKEGLNPVKRLKHAFKGLFTRGKNSPLVNMGVNMGIDVLLKRMVLARAGLISKLVIPFVAKNITSHIVNEDERNRILRSIKRFFKKVTSKKTDGSPAPDAA